MQSSQVPSPKMSTASLSSHTFSMMIVCKYMNHLLKTLAFGMENSLKEAPIRQTMGKSFGQNTLSQVKILKSTATSSILLTAMTSPRNGTPRTPNGLHDLQTYFPNNTIQNIVIRSQSRKEVVSKARYKDIVGKLSTANVPFLALLRRLYVVFVRL